MLSVSIRGMQSKYRNAGNDWNDSKYQQLGDIVNECNSSIKKTLYELNGCLAALNEIEKIVMEYESVNFNGQSSFSSDNNMSSVSAIGQGYGYETSSTGETEMRNGLMRRFAAVLTALVSALIPPTITLSENETRIQNDIPIVRRMREINEGQGDVWPWVESIQIREDELDISSD
jgi:hypothetical protein